MIFYGSEFFFLPVAVIFYRVAMFIVICPSFCQANDLELNAG